jgi:glycosyltransferase involved in cell wall biosynthesis
MVIAPSEWLAREARRSSLLRDCEVVAIPYTIDLDLFRPRDRVACRRELGWPPDGRVVAFGALRALEDQRKGFVHFREAIDRIRTCDPTREFRLVVFGTDAPGVGGWQPPYPTTWMGTVTREADLARLLAAVDVLVVPSQEDNLPNIIVEASACGIPVAAFGVGGIPEMILHRETGWVARPRCPDDLARGIQYCLDMDQLVARSTARALAVAKYGDTAVEAHLQAYAQLSGRGDA